jgi:hypothetical protein
MSESLKRANGLALALCRDAYGNGISGNSERSLRYTKAAIELLELAGRLDADEAKADAQVQTWYYVFERDLDTWPPFAFNDEAMHRNAKAGLTLQALPDAKLPASVLKNIKGGKPGASKKVRLKGEEAAEFVKSLRN